MTSWGITTMLKRDKCLLLGVDDHCTAPTWRWRYFQLSSPGKRLHEWYTNSRETRIFSGRGQDPTQWGQFPRFTISQSCRQCPEKKKIVKFRPSRPNLSFRVLPVLGHGGKGKTWHVRVHPWGIGLSVLPFWGHWGEGKT